MPTLTFIPSGRRVAVPEGTLLSDACREAGFPVHTSCGGRGICGKCRVHILQGDVPVNQAQMGSVTASLLAAGWRAACVTRVAGDLVVAEPSGGAMEPVVATEFQGRQPGRGSGFWMCDLSLAPPAPGDKTPDAERLLQALKDNGATDGRRAINMDGLRLPLLADLPRTLRSRAFALRVAGIGRHILDFRGIPEGKAEPLLGLAVDLGTTTMAAALCDLATGRILSVVSAMNPQAAWGDDVMSRIDYAGRSREHRDEMRLVVVEKIAFLAEEARRAAKMEGDVLVASVAANTAMSHLLLGASAEALAVGPFVPAFCNPVSVWGREIGWPEGRDPLFLVMPGIASYVGGDVTAGLLAHGVLESGESILFVDVGTNGEIVLAARGKAYACAAAAGPAFEGARISRGMCAGAGAISRVDWTEGKFECGVIGGGAARGVCGTGILDAVAALLESGIVDAGGRMAWPEELLDMEPGGGAAKAVHMNGRMPAAWLVPPEAGGGGVSVTQRDVREVQLAKGAIAAGIRVLMERAGIRAAELDHVLLAGGFGSFLRPRSAMAVGLLPGGIAPERIKAVGNAALAGARLYLHSEEERQSAKRIREGIEYVELGGDREFEEAFAEEMLFPTGRGEDLL